MPFFIDVRLYELQTGGVRVTSDEDPFMASRHQVLCVMRTLERTNRPDRGEAFAHPGNVPCSRGKCDMRFDLCIRSGQQVYRIYPSSHPQGLATQACILGIYRLPLTMIAPVAYREDLWEGRGAVRRHL